MAIPNILDFLQLELSAEDRGLLAGGLAAHYHSPGAKETYAFYVSPESVPARLAAIKSLTREFLERETKKSI